jgi:hypothetical protein
MEKDFKYVPLVMQLTESDICSLRVFAAQVARDVLDIVSEDRQHNGPDILDRMWKIRILDIWRERCENQRGKLLNENLNSKT